MTSNMRETIRNIQMAIEVTFGFAPAMNKIKPLEADEKKRYYLLDRFQCWW